MLAPPPEAERTPSAAVSFQASSGIYIRAESIVSLPEAPSQYVVVEVLGGSPKNSFPPIPVTSGIAAGTSTAKPKVADATWPSQSAAPESPEEATIVWPWLFACCAHP